jgi:hypothetical protein
MRLVYRILPVLAAVGLSWVVSTASAQQMTVGTPFHSLNNNWFENIGSNWSLQGQGWTASFGMPSMAQPQFGGFNPGAGLGFGFAILNPSFTGKFNFNFSQGNNASLVSSTPMVTLQNGVPGYFSDTTQAPFVISVIPVVGGFSPVTSVNPAMPLPLDSPFAGLSHPAVAQALQRARAQRAAMDDDEAIGPSAAQAAVRAQADQGPPPLPQKGVRPRAQAPAAAPALARPQHDLVLAGQAGRPDAAAASEAASRVARATESSAGRAVPSVAEARRIYEAQQHEGAADGEIAEYLARAQNAENLGKPSVARQYYRLALRHATAAQREEIQGRIDALAASSSGRDGEK